MQKNINSYINCIYNACAYKYQSHKMAQNQVSGIKVIVPDLNSLVTCALIFTFNFISFMYNISGLAYLQTL